MLNRISVLPAIALLAASANAAPPNGSDRQARSRGPDVHDHPGA